METDTEPRYATVRRYSQVFAKNSDGKFAVFFSDHQKDKDLFDDQGTPWLDSMEQIFAWNHLFRWHPEIDRDETFAEWHKKFIFRKLSSDEIARLSILGRPIVYNDLTFDGTPPKPPFVGDLADKEIVDYATLRTSLKEVDEPAKESTVE